MGKFSAEQFIYFGLRKEGFDVYSPSCISTIMDNPDSLDFESEEFVVALFRYFDW